MLHNLEQFMQEEGKQKLKSNSIPRSFLNESFGAFVDFAGVSSTGKQATTLWFDLTSVLSLKTNWLPGPAATWLPIFGDILNYRRTGMFGI